MAVHGALVAGRTGAPAAGYLVGLRRVLLQVARLDDIETDLLISAERVSGDDAIIIYQFSVYNTRRSFLSGRATVALDAGALGRGSAGAVAP
jgi:predicted hotdog family 3-hydroxylacyl-ACP dehydratase